MSAGPIGKVARVAAGVPLLILAMALATNPAPIDYGTGGNAVPANMAPCNEEDGSGAGQAFPCLWDAVHRGNGRGRSFVLTQRVCTDAEAALAMDAHRRSLPLTVSCEDRESVAIVG